MTITVRVPATEPIPITTANVTAVPVTTQAPAPLPVPPPPVPTMPAIVVGRQPDSSYEEPPVQILKDSRFVQLSAKEVKNLDLPRFLQLELDFSPLKEGETINASRNSSIRHAGKP